MITTYIKAGALALAFPSQALADIAPPLLFDPSDNPFMNVVHGCTVDGVLMEVRFGFEFSPAFTQRHLDTPEDLERVIQGINTYVEGDISMAWKNILGGMEFADIESGEEKPLKPLLETLYQFTDENFNAMLGYDYGDNIYPVLRGGAYEMDNSLCLPNP